MLKKYIRQIEGHIDSVKELEDFPKTGVITIEYDIDQDAFTSTISNSEVSTRGNGGTTGSGTPFP